MRWSILIAVAFGWVGHGLALADAEPTLPDRVEFNRDIRPILSDHCFACHGPDKNKREAELRLDVREDAVAKSAIAPRDLDGSELYWRVTSEEEAEVMPPPESNKPLDARKKALLKKWIEQGAEYQPHWAYIAPTRPAVPELDDPRARVANPIDAFVQGPLLAQGIAPAAEADRRTLIRRVSLDLTGLPPTPEEVEGFVNDTASNAYEALVDRLLASPRYGERMAVPWLDVVRYADTVGFHGDQNQNVWAYRDYVIEAFNANKPFDQFTREQLAGDLLPEPAAEQRVATCFNRLNMVTREGGAQPKEYLAKYAADRVRTVGMAWLGSTLACAECHDHKFDPITTKDFYSLGAFFSDIRQWGVYADYGYTPNPDLKGYGNDHPFPPEITVENAYLQRRIATLRNRLAEVVASAGAGLEPADAEPRKAFDAWRGDLAAYLATNPGGWVVPDPEVQVDQAKPARKAGAKPASAQVAEPEPATVAEDGTIAFAGGKATADTIRLEPGAMRVAAVRVEILPDAARGGSILRSGNAATLNVELALQRAGAEKPGPLAVRFADADRADPRYAGSLAVLGIQTGWLTQSGAKDQPHTGVWILERPVEAAPGDVVVVKVPNDLAAKLRVSVSPLVPEDPRRSEAPTELVKAIATGGEAAAADPAVQAAYLRSTAWNADAFQQTLGIEAEIRACRDGRTPVQVVEAWEPAVARVLPRGNWQDESGEVVLPAVLHFLPQPEAATSGHRLSRLDLADWLTSQENPLTARVFVNRLWKQFFGSGLSPQVDDLGAQGEAPSHPELLDWLAVEFRESGWDVKHVVKRIVMSATYRQSSNPSRELLEKDPGNRWLARQSARRLEAEFVRDNALAITGLIHHDLGGPSCFPYQPPRYYENLQFPDRDYVASADERQYRRGVYMHWQRTFLHPMLANFDAPSREDCVAARTQANSPQQALTLLNDPEFVEAARVMAVGVLTCGAATDEERIDRLFRQAVARPAKAKEVEALVAFLKRMREEYGSRPEDAAKLLRVGMAPPAEGVDAVEAAAWASVCRVVLNLHETITRY